MPVCPPVFIVILLPKSLGFISYLFATSFKITSLFSKAISVGISLYVVFLANSSTYQLLQEYPFLYFFVGS